MCYNPVTYIINSATTISRKYTYASDLAISHVGGDWQAVIGVLSKDMATVGEYLWKQQLYNKCRQSSTSTTRKLDMC